MASSHRHFGVCDEGLRDELVPGDQRVPYVEVVRRDDVAVELVEPSDKRRPQRLTTTERV